MQFIEVAKIFFELTTFFLCSKRDSVGNSEKSGVLLLTGKQKIYNVDKLFGACNGIRKTQE